MRLLIVDDDVLDLTLMKSLAEELGCEAVCFASSTEALDWCGANEPDLVVLDYMMPPPDGMEFLMKFRQIKFRDEVPVIMVSASDEREVRYQALELGASDFLGKPIDKVEFITRIKNLLALRLSLGKLSERESELREGKDFLKDVLNCIQDCIVILDKDLTIIMVNPAVERMHSDRAPFEGRKCYEAFHGRTEPCPLCPALITAGTGEKGFDIVPFGAPGATRGWLELHTYPLVNSRTGELVGVIEYRRDITRSKKAEDALRELKDYLQALYEASPDMVFLHDGRGRLIDVNDNVLREYGVTYEEMLEGDPSDFMGGDCTVDAAREKIGRALAGEKTDFEWVARRKNGEEFPVEVRLRKVESVVGEAETHTYVIAVVRNITQRKLAEERLEQLAHYDVLTGLPNRTLFFDRLNHAVSLAKRDGKALALLFMDLDGFKFINDNLGHAAGDAVLKGVSGRLLSCVRESDTVARMGGDEFTLILERIAGNEDAGVVAEKIADALEQPFTLGGTESYIGASIGISVFPEDGVDNETLLKKADIAMYRAKKTKGRKYMFYQDEEEVGPAWP